MRSTLGLALLVVAGGCSHDLGALRGLDAGTEDSAVADSALPDVVGTDADIRDAPLDVGMEPDARVDGGSDAGADAGPSCTDVAPLEAMEAGTVADRVICDLSEVLTQNDVGVSIGRAEPAATPETYDGMPVSACVGVRFAEAPTMLVIRVRVAGLICGGDARCTGTACGFGRRMLVFSGDEPSSASQLFIADMVLPPGEGVVIGPARPWFDLALSSTLFGQWVVLCRRDNPTTWSNAEIDTVTSVQCDEGTDR